MVWQVQFCYSPWHCPVPTTKRRSVVQIAWRSCRRGCFPGRTLDAGKCRENAKTVKLYVADLNVVHLVIPRVTTDHPLFTHRNALVHWTRIAGDFFVVCCALICQTTDPYPWPKGNNNIYPSSSHVFKRVYTPSFNQHNHGLGLTSLINMSKINPVNNPSIQVPPIYLQKWFKLPKVPGHWKAAGDRAQHAPETEAPAMRLSRNLPGSPFIFMRAQWENNSGYRYRYRCRFYKWLYDFQCVSNKMETIVETYQA